MRGHWKLWRTWSRANSRISDFIDEMANIVDVGEHSISIDDPTSRERWAFSTVPA